MEFLSQFFVINPKVDTPFTLFAGFILFVIAVWAYAYYEFLNKKVDNKHK